MPIIFCSLCALAVASLYYGWREYHTRLTERDHELRRRVAYMLWVMADAAMD